MSHTPASSDAKQGKPAGHCSTNLGVAVPRNNTPPPHTDGHRHETAATIRAHRCDMRRLHRMRVKTAPKEKVIIIFIPYKN